MTRENQEALIRAYRAAIVAEQSEIADMLEKLILSEMRTNGPVMRGIKTGDGETQIETPWHVTCEPGVTLLGAKMECTGIDYLSKEVTE